MASDSDPPIVAIGASAGGVKALQTFFEALPDKPNAAFVVVIPLDPEFRGQLADILAARTTMPVAQVEQTATLAINRVYVIAANSRLVIADHTISVVPFTEPRSQRAPIDLVFRSLAEQHSSGSAYAIILSGAGADGAVGIKSIKDSGGIVLVQDPLEAEYASMPRNAIAAAVADFVLPIRGLAKQLVELLNDGNERASLSGRFNDEKALRRILGHVRASIGHDFSLYKRAAILRRIARRMQVTRKQSLAEYYKGPGEGGPTAEMFRQLQEELRLAHDRIRAIREESEAATEELRAANEELQSINEELQSVNNVLKLELESVPSAHSDLQNLMAAADFGMLFLDTSLHIQRFTPRLTELFNVTTSDEGRLITDFTNQLEYDRFADDVRAVLRDLAPVQHEVASRNGARYLVRIRPYRTVDDEIDGVVATFLDITELRGAEDSLRVSEARLIQEMRLVELSRSPIFVWDYDSGALIQWNRGSEELYGYSRQEALGAKTAPLLQTAVPGSSFEHFRRSLLENGTWSGELLHRTKDGRVLTVESQIELAPTRERRLVIECTRDVTERKKWEKRQQSLLAELSHRVTNTLAVIQSLARQTLHSVGAGDDFVPLFEGRLDALASAHNLLVEARWQGAEFSSLARGQLAAYTSDDPGRLRLEGDPLVLPADFVTPFGLALHELAANAAKYGAFSVETGQVLVSWTVDEMKDRRLLKVVWRESGGPPVTPPKKTGFGGLLIERGLPGATVRREFARDGMICTIEFELPLRQDDGTHD